MPSLSTTHRPAHQAHNPVGQLAAEHPGLVKIGRAGWFAKGVVYAIAGVLAVSIAARASGWSKSPTTGNQEASPTGAIKTVAGSGAGTLLLWLLAIGMFLYAAWRVVAALLPGGKDGEAIVRRIGYIVSAVVYASFGFSAIALARRSPKTPDGNQKVTDISASFMKHGFGRFVIGAVGLIIIGVGLYRIYKGFTKDVNDELDLSGMSPGRAKWSRYLGSIGEIGRGVGFALVGFFMLRAAMTYNAAEATGLDGALRRVAEKSWGVWVVLLVGIGFAAYGLFCLTTFTHRRLEAP